MSSDNDNTPEFVLRHFMSMNDINLVLRVQTVKPADGPFANGPQLAWLIVFQRNGAGGPVLITPFYSRDLPDPVGIFDCLLSDTQSVDDMTFEDWADDFDFDEDSRKALKVYERSLAQAKAVKEFLGDDLFAEAMSLERL